MKYIKALSYKLFIYMYIHKPHEKRKMGRFRIEQKAEGSIMKVNHTLATDVHVTCHFTTQKVRNTRIMPLIFLFFYSNFETIRLIKFFGESLENKNGNFCVMSPCEQLMTPWHGIAAGDSKRKAQKSNTLNATLK